MATEDNNNNSSVDSSARSPARLRAEARKQKILSKGNDRLAKITGAMKSSHYNSQTESVNQQSEKLDSDEPPEVDISKLDSNQDKRSSLSRHSTNKLNSSSQPPRSSINEENPVTKKKLSKQSQSIMSPDRPFMESSMPPNAADPMLQMMKAMGLELPTGSNPNGMFGSNEAPNPMMQQAFASMNGMPQKIEKTWIDRIFPFLNLLTVITLILSSILWWNPMSNYWRQIQPFSSDDTNLNIDLKAEWDALHPSGSTPTVRQALGPAPVFWMFVTIELVLQATKWMFNRGTGAPPGLLSTLIYSLPGPYSTLASTVLKYFAIISNLIDDLCILVFGVGCAVIWFEWKYSSENSLFDLLKPN